MFILLLAICSALTEMCIRDRIWNVAQSGENEFTATYEVDQLIKEGDQTKAVSATYTVAVHVDADGNMAVSYTHLGMTLSVPAVV